MTPAVTRRTNKTFEIPEDTQKPLRRRLRLIRESRGLTRSDIETVTSGTLRKYEEETISSLSLGDLYGIALEYGVSLGEMLHYLVSTDADELSDEGRRMQRMLIFMRSLDEEDQELACDLIQRVVSRNVNNRSRSVYIKKAEVRESRDIAREALLRERLKE